MTEGARRLPGRPAARPTGRDDPAEAGRIPRPPRGWERAAMVGPGFLWMVSAAGSGELLFTPRVAAQYGYTLLWAMVAAVVLKWFINREIGRFAVCTGGSVLEGFKELPGPRNWAVWIILVPQLLVAAASIAGLASSAATALILVLPGDVRLWMIVSISASTLLVVLGRYRKVEVVARVLAVTLAIAGLAAASSVFPRPEELAAGLVPRVPPGVDYGEILPWLGYMLSGAAGMIWYSYWVNAKGYGAAGEPDQPRRSEDGRVASLVRPADLPPEDRERLRGWIGQMTLDTTVAVVGGLLITTCFLILGAELLKPRGLVPEESKVAATLGHLLGGVWGPVGFWFMVLGVFVGFWDTVLSDQDGFGRMFANGTRILLRPSRWSSRLEGRWLSYEALHRAFVIVLVTLIPIGLFLTVGEPVALLKLAGAIEAAHIPVVTGLILYLNHRWLPEDLRPSVPVTIITTAAGLFFAGFAVFYALRLLGVWT